MTEGIKINEAIKRFYRRATVPGRYLWGFFTPPVVGADFLAAFILKRHSKIRPLTNLAKHKYLVYNHIYIASLQQLW